MLPTQYLGVDSTANTATYATWEISRHPEIQEKARKEVMETFPGGFETVNLKTLQSMRYLNGCIAETLRLHAPLPGLPTRICPEPGVEFHGHLIPAGVSSSNPETIAMLWRASSAQPTSLTSFRWDQGLLRIESGYRGADYDHFILISSHLCKLTRGCVA